MRTSMIMGCVCSLSFSFSFPVFAFELPQSNTATMAPQIPDMVPNDGVLDAGSLTNPMVIQGSNGARYEVRPQIPDIVPNDGVLDAGSLMNPMVIEQTE